MNTHSRKWYITVIAGIYVLLCGGFSVYYASLYFRVGGATVAFSKQFLCLGMAISAAVYFFNAKVGHSGLLALTALTILTIGTTDPNATAFHATVLLVLLIPFAMRQSNRTSDHANEVVQGTLEGHRS
ncbi:MAG: hypothetical protein JXN61_01380 [Sedimentisphaerales bacterium]|nr:hypothetical protein [Sedimentisphaerales bacterium]